MLLRRALALLFVLAALVSGAVATAQPAATGPHTVYLPLASSPLVNNGVSPFGFDFRVYVSNAAMPYVREAQPRWSRAGDLMWADVERVRGVYQWEAAASLEANIERLRSAGVEPTVVIQHTPAWAQRGPGARCSPPRPDAVADFARFVRAAAARYPQVKFWEIWNEPDFTAEQADDSDGFGCWADASLPHYGGEYYGQVLKQVYPAVKAANPNAFVLGGALAYDWPNNQVSLGFLEGILASGAGNAMDALSFHAYGDYGASDLLLNKATNLRRTLARYGLANKPLFATEIGVLCTPSPSCLNGFASRQANYAARIYAQAVALDLLGAFWFSLVLPTGNDIGNPQLIDEVNGTLQPRPAYYAFRNSALLLDSARYIGPPLAEPPPSQYQVVQVLQFRKARSSFDASRASTLYVLWVPKTDFPLLYNLPVAPGATAVCTDHLSNDVPSRYMCSDGNRDGLIPRAVNMLPQYVEVLD